MVKKPIKIIFKDGSYAITNGQINVNDPSTEATITLGIIVITIQVKDVLTLEPSDEDLGAGLVYIRYDKDGNELRRI